MQIPPIVGQLLGGRYQVVQTLSSGGFGRTYVAIDTHRPGNPQCVVKQLKPVNSSEEVLKQARRLFAVEAETLERLGQSEQIPRLLAYFEQVGEFYLVMEYIEGHPLSREMQMGQQWTEKQVCRMLHEVLRILEYVHGKGVIHRDIKPDNLIRRASDKKLVMVDFGAVKRVRTAIHGGEAPVNFTIPIGTLGYLPAEQRDGHPRFNSDIYALGMTAIQALTGFNPGQLRSDPDTLERVWRPYATHASEALLDILERMVLFHFRERYQAVGLVLHDLEPLMQRYAETSASAVGQSAANRQSVPNPTPMSGTIYPSTPNAIASGNPSTPPSSPPSSPPHSPPSFPPTHVVPSVPPNGIVSVNPANPSTPPSSPSHSPPSFPPTHVVPLVPPNGIVSANSANPSTPPQTPVNIPPIAPVGSVPGSSVGQSGGGREASANLNVRTGSVNSGSNSPPVTASVAPVHSNMEFNTLVSSLPSQSGGQVGSISTGAAKSKAWLWIAGLTVLIALVGGGFGVQYWMQQQSYSRAQGSLRQAKTLQAEKKYEACAQELAGISQSYPDLYDSAQILANDCQLAHAQQLAEQGNHRGALEVVSQIPQDSSAQTRAQELTDRWSEQVLVSATKHYQAGKLEEAIAEVNVIPQTSSLYGKAQEQIKQWQQEWQANQQHLDKAKQALDQKQWQAAIAEANKATTDYWKQQAAPILQQANEGLAADRRNATPSPAPRQPAPEPVYIPPAPVPEPEYIPPVDPYVPPPEPEYIPPVEPYVPPPEPEYIPPAEPYVPPPASGGGADPDCPQGVCL